MVIYVGNLHYDVREDILSDLFAEFGEVVSTRVVIDRETNRSKGFGFVEMADDNAGENAINALGGKEVNGRALKISKANPPAPKGQRSGGGGYGGGNRGPRSFGGDRGGNGGGGYRGGNDRGGYGGGDRGNDRGGYGNDRGNDRGGYNRGGGDRDYNNDNY
jgi:RNA recognition motif-containing protein